jgi:hypothetical protein
VQRGARGRHAGGRFGGCIRLDDWFAEQLHAACEARTIRVEIVSGASKRHAVGAREFPFARDRDQFSAGIVLVVVGGVNGQRLTTFVYQRAFGGHRAEL